jgi:hypothetical protein
MMWCVLFVVYQELVQWFVFLSHDVMFFCLSGSGLAIGVVYCWLSHDVMCFISFLRPVQQSEYSRLFAYARFWTAVFAIVKKRAHANNRERSLLLNTGLRKWAGGLCCLLHDVMCSVGFQEVVRRFRCCLLLIVTWYDVFYRFSGSGAAIQVPFIVNCHMVWCVLLVFR